MTIVASELKTLKAEVNNSTSANGGRVGLIEAVSGVSNAFFPVANNAERVAGRTWYSKRFYKVANAANESLANAYMVLDNPTPGDDKILLFAGTQTNTQGDLTGSELKYSAGLLANAVAIAATTLIVNVDASAGADNIFRDGMRIRVTDKATPDSLTGNESILTISGVPGVVGDQVTITVAAPGFDVGYSAGAKVSGIMEVGTVGCSVNNVVVTSAGGDYDNVNFPITGNNIGCIEDSITLTFTSGSAFNITSALLGSLGSGSIGAGASPTNPDYAVDYWVVDSAGFTGTFLAGDTITFDTHPANVPFFLKQVIPPNCASLAGNSVLVVLYGETVG